MEGPKGLLNCNSKFDVKFTDATLVTDDKKLSVTLFANLPWIHFSINKSWTIFLFYHDGVKRLKRVSKIFETNQIMIQNIHAINVIIKLYDLHIFIYT